MSDTDAKTVERIACKVDTRPPYYSAIQIAVGDHGVGDLRTVLGQGDYPTLKEIADRMTQDGIAAAAMLRALAAERDALAARVAELEAAVNDALCRYQVTHIHSALRAALQENTQ